MTKIEIYLRITDACNLACEHCCFDCTKQGKSLKKEEIDRITANLPENLSKVIISGGEPFIKKPLLYHTIDQLRERYTDTISIEVLTNGSWAVNDRVIRKTLEQLAQKSVSQLSITSNDAYHFAQGITKEMVENLETQAKKILPSVISVGIPEDKVFPIGRAAKLPKEKHYYFGKCGTHYAISPHGELYRCGWCITPPFGNIIDENFDTIISESQKDARLKAIHQGKITQAYGKPTSQSPCKTCYEIFYKKQDKTTIPASVFPLIDLITFGCNAHFV